jgi:hypothetical protein
LPIVKRSGRDDGRSQLERVIREPFAVEAPGEVAAGGTSSKVYEAVAEKLAATLRIVR